MAFQADIVAYDASDRLVLVVEIKNRRGTNSQWVARMRQQLAAYGQVADARYLLLALPDRFYLWVDKRPELSDPDYTIDPLPLLKPYLGTPNVSEYLGEVGFEMVVEAWLASLTWAEKPPTNTGENADWLIESGLFDALKHGHLASEVTL